MLRKREINDMAAGISARIQQLEAELKEEYKKLIRISSDFDDIAAELVVLERKRLPESVKQYEVTALLDRLHVQVGKTFGCERDQEFILEAAVDVMEENAAAALNSRL